MEWRRALTALGLGCALTALLPLAQASLPDQTWRPGLYDNADYDDVVLLVTSGVFVEPTPVVVIHRPLPVGLTPSPAVVVSAAVSAVRGRLTRAPPA